ncbi:hypothetical protein BDW62DRAFT_210271 [Aspergillus aurantiobrunneus]
MERNNLRSLSPVPEEEGKSEEKVREEKKDEDEAMPDAGTETESDDGALPLELDVHGLKAKVYLSCADVDIVPGRYLEKADHSHLLRRTPWIFRAVKDGRDVNINKWSKVDIRFRGVFKTLKKVPPFANGLFDGDSSGRMVSRSSSRMDFDEAVKAQGQVVYALFDEILNMLKIRREAESHQQCFFLRPRLVCCQPEYWTGYRVKHKDTPITAGSVALDYEPSRGIPRAVMPIVTTTERRQTVKSALEGEFKLLLAQLLVNAYRLSPPGDKIPDQEAFLISLHGSKLHVLRGIFPGQKTSMLWCGRHTPSELDSQSTHNLVAAMSDRFYSKLNLERVMEQVEWNQLSNPENEASPRSFQILASREYDLWMKSEFSAALKMLSGLVMYLMSGQARCGVLQHVFERYPYDEGIEPESDDGKEKAAKEQREVEEEEEKLKEKEKRKREEEKARVNEREAMRSSMKDKIGGLTEGFRQPWWDWVWDDKSDEGLPMEDEDTILGGF